MKHTDKNNRPESIPPNFDGIPQKLKLIDGWLLWTFEWKEDARKPAWAKVPYDAKTFFRASSTNPECGSSFAVVQAAYLSNKHRFDGIGFLMGNGLLGVDIDNCVENDGIEDMISDFAQDQVDAFRSYTELTPSGTGLHILVLSDEKHGRKDSSRGVEVYGHSRYFTVTGHSWHRIPLDVIGNPAALKRLMDTFPKHGEKKTETRPPEYAYTGPRLDADAVLQKAFAAKNGADIRRLYDGDISGYNDDHSSADYAFCLHLAFYVGDDSGLLDSIFRGSRLYRTKWDERHHNDGSTYGEETIRRAMDECQRRYTERARVKERRTQEKQEPREKRKGRYTIEELADRVFRYYEAPLNTGYRIKTLPNFSKHYRPRKGTYTIVIGEPGSGKTSLSDAIAYYLYRDEGIKWSICGMETLPLERKVANLANMVMRKPFFRGENPRMTREELQCALEILNGKFFLLHPDEDDQNMPGVLSLIQEDVEEFGVEGFVIDPYTELVDRRPAGVTETEMAKYNLSLMRHCVTRNDLIGILDVHPQKLPPDKKTSKTPVPRLYDVSGSAHFANKTDFGLSIYRRKDKRGREVTEVHVLKVRFEELGLIGQVDLRFDAYEKQYFEVEYERTSAGEQWDQEPDENNSLQMEDVPF